MVCIWWRMVLSLVLLLVHFDLFTLLSVELIYNQPQKLDFESRFRSDVILKALITNWKLPKTGKVGTILRFLR